MSGEISRFEKQNQEDLEYEKCDNCTCNCGCIGKHHKEIGWMIWKTTVYHTEYSTVTEGNVVKNSQVEKNTLILENDSKGPFSMSFGPLPCDISLVMRTAKAKSMMMMMMMMMMMIIIIIHSIFFKSNLGFCLELGLLNSETEIGTGVA